MGIQINGQTDTISAVDGSLSVSGADLTTLTQVNVTGVGTFGNGLNVTGGSVGIGTINPSEALHLLKSGATSTNIRFQNSSGNVFVGNDNDGDAFVSADTNGKNIKLYTSGTERLRITSSGNIGIGTVPQSWSGFRSLQLGGTTSIWSVEGGQAGSSFYSNNIYYDGSNRRYLTNNSASEYIQDASTGNHVFYEASSGTAGNTLSGYTEIARFTSSGLKLPNGSGIDFSATSDGSGTTSSELLDDYEVGTWTPAIEFGGTTIDPTGYIVGGAGYVKIGHLVYVGLTITSIEKGSATGELKIKGLPFTVEGTYSNTGDSSGICRWQGISTTSGTIVAYFNYAQTYMILQKFNASSGYYGNVLAADCDTSISLYFVGGWYYADR